MRVTQKAIAAKMGVSISLVSRVLSGTAAGIGVPHETIAAIKEVAKRMGYVPNRAAQALKGKSTQTIGVVVYDFKDPFFSDFVATLQEKLHSKGYSTVLVGFSDRQISEQDLSPLRQHILDAVIILGSGFGGSVQQEIQMAPFFRIGHSFEDEQIVSFCPDEEKAASDLAAYLTGLDCRLIRLVQGAMPHHQYRAEAMLKALKSSGLEVQQTVLEGTKLFDAGRDFATDFFTAKKLPDVIVCTVDHLALGVMKGLLASGLRIPEDVKVTGFDDIQLASQYFPSLTTFAQPMGSVVDRILDRIHASHFTYGVERFSCPLVPRRSC